jgi:hypothetical protein
VISIVSTERVLHSLQSRDSVCDGDVREVVVEVELSEEGGRRGSLKSCSCSILSLCNVLILISRWFA